MGYRLTRIYTRTGDQGETGLGTGERIAKDHPRIEAIGSIDELNSALGVVASFQIPDLACNQIRLIQHWLFTLGGELSLPGQHLLDESIPDQMERWIDDYNLTLPVLEEFVLPGGARVAACTHVARTACRRAERCLVTLGHQGMINPVASRMLNRLSDLLFVLARHFNQIENEPEIFWEKRSKLS